MKVAFYSPYLNLLGGGERYLLTIASILSNQNDVDLFWEDEQILKMSEEKFGLNLGKIKIKRFPQNKINRYFSFENYDLLFYMTDGSLFFSGAKKNILIIQSPVHIPPTSFFSKIKLKNWPIIICYSQFMSKIIESKLNIKPKVLFVPVDSNEFKPNTKENIVLSVARFFPNLHSKKQEVLVEVFNNLISKIPDWKLYLVGSIDPGGEEYLNKVRQKITSPSIKILTEVNFDELKNIYGKSKIFWHAAGFGEDLTTYPEKAEHFGVVTLEAMASGLVPVVFNGGGQPELIDNGIDGFLWNSKEELENFTLKLISDDSLREKMSKMAQKKASSYSPEEFLKGLYEIIK